MARLLGTFRYVRLMYQCKIHNTNSYLKLYYYLLKIQKYPPEKCKTNNFNQFYILILSPDSDDVTYVQQLQ